MELNYTDEFILNEDGIKCQVLDVSKIDFREAPSGRKSKETLVIKANGNERIETINSDGLVETVYITNAGDAIFANNDKDVYVPRDSSGSSLKFESIEDYGYEITSDEFSYKESIAVKVKSTKTFKVLPGIIIIPTCIKDAWGKGMHQFLFDGAALKKDMETGKVTGIERGAFESTWELIGASKKL